MIGNSLPKKFRKTLYATFTTSVILILAFSFFSFSNINDLIHDQEAISHTNEVLFNLEQIISEIKDAETGQRGYLLTSNKEFLENYYGAYERTHNNYDEVRRLTQDNVSQQMRLDTLAQLIEVRFHELDERLELDFTPQNDVRNQELLGIGKDNMDRIRGIIIRMKDFEIELLNYRTTNAKDSIQITYIILGVFTVLTIMIIIVSFSFTVNEFQHRAEIELKLEDSINNLKATNENLEQFAYVASHDLQEPLRKIQSFGDLLKSDYADKLPEQASDYIGRMHNAAERMQVLINDLLNFSRASRNVGEYETVILREKIMHVLEDLEITIRESKAKINLDLSSEFSVYGNRPQLSRLFQNLISNAIKFHKKGEVPEIQIISKLYDTAENIYGFKIDINKKYVEIDVVDNGIGFDEQYREKMFTIFQRLHGRMDYKGTGIGLALCKKIAENHNGFITAKGRPDEGSTFIVILPIKQN